MSNKICQGKLVNRTHEKVNLKRETCPMNLIMSTIIHITQELRKIQYEKAVKSLYGLFLKLFQMRETKFFLQNVLL
jgi:hypothetical protein